MAFRLQPRGPFSLTAAARFAEGFPATEIQHFGDGLRFAWALDDDWRVVHVTLTQHGGAVAGELEGSPPADLARHARTEVERILSLDVDGRDFPALGERDPVVGQLQRHYRGLRPVLFFSPYEAAAWAIIGQRVRMSQAAVVKRRLSAELGEGGAFPDPARLTELKAPQRGLTERKIEQLRALGQAALDGELGRARLRRLSFEDAAESLRRLPGIGPFSADLILIRGVGWPDALPSHEPRLERAVRAAYGLGADAEIEPVAGGWRPYRSWVALLLRAWLEAETGEIGAPGADPPSEHAVRTGAQTGC